MKIVCDSCGAKYSIADEKVAGKTFRIRCKRCSAPIIVRGEGLASPDVEAAEAAAPAPHDPTAVWHVVVDGDQKGPYPLEQVQEMLAMGRLDQEGYVWREGFDGWLPAREVPELARDSAPTRTEREPAAPARAPAAAYAEAFPPAGAQAPVASRATHDAGADLFAPADPVASPFAAVTEDEDVVASAPSSPRPAAAGRPALTGQRNENSVLFSLQNLQALATGGSEPERARPAAPRPGSAAAIPAEGSGLIDIRALAGATAGRGGDARRVDDLLSIGGASPGIGGTSLGAPVLAPAADPEPKQRGLMVAILGGALLLAGTGIAVAFILKPGPTTIVQAAPEPTAAAPGAGAAPPATTPAPEEPAAPAQPAAAGAEGEGPARPEGTKASARVAGASRTARAPRDEPSEPAAASASSRSTKRDANDIDSLLDRALDGPSKNRPAAAASENLPETPSREDVARALRSVESAVQACGQGEHGVAMTQVTVSGSNGRVSRAIVQGQFAGTPVGSCVARAVRDASFPRFSRPTFTVTFPYRL